MQIDDVVREADCALADIFAWHFKKGIASPVIGATKEKYLDDAAGAFDLQLTDEDVAAIDAHYLPHVVMGAL